jgi:hypothetical protein
MADPQAVTDPDILKKLNAGSSSSSSTSSAPGAVSDPEILKKLEPPKAEPSSRLWQVIRGGGRGIASLLQSANEILPDVGSLIPLPERSKEAKRKGQEELRKFTDAPSESGWETGGRLAGQTLPLMFMPGLGATSVGGSIAERAALGAVAGGLQPTPAHTATSHIPGAIAGGVTAGGGRALTSYGGPTLEWLSQNLGKGTNRAVLGAVLEQPIEQALKLGGMSDKDARKYSVMVSGALIASGLLPAGGAPDVTNVLGSIAARVGGAAAGDVVNQIPSITVPRRKRSDEK